MPRCCTGSIARLLVATLSVGCAGEISGGTGNGDSPSGGASASGDKTGMAGAGAGSATPGTGGPGGSNPAMGSPVGGGGPSVPKGPLRAADLAPARARPLTATEIRNSIGDIFFAGSLTRVPSLDGASHEGFSNDYQAADVSQGFMDTFETFTAAAAVEIVKDLARVSPCNVGAMGGPACAASFIGTYGPLVYRRPLDATESMRLRDTFAAVSKLGTYEQGVEAVVQVMLMAPQFMYRTELGAGKDASGIVSLTAYERAAALSYALWQTSPDAALTAAAANGGLMTAAGLRTEINRLMSSPRAKTTLRTFVGEWLVMDPTAVSKNDRSFTPAVARAVDEEAGRFVDDVLGRSEGALTALWTSTRTYVNASVAKLYGIDAPANTSTAVEMPADQQRGGILSLPAFVASHTQSETFSPIELALVLRDRVLCFDFPPPPAAVPDPPVNPAWSVRQKLEKHRSDPACGSCHALLDPLGFGFERLGVTGQYRTVELPSKAALTGEGELTGTDVDGRFVGPAELGRKFAESAQVRSCVAGQALSYLLGRPTGHAGDRTPADQLALRDVLASGTSGAKGDVRALLADLATAETFVRRDGSRLP